MAKFTNTRSCWLRADSRRLIAWSKKRNYSPGANAVVATRFTTSMMMGGAAELLAVATAVVTEDED